MQGVEPRAHRGLLRPSAEIGPVPYKPHVPSRAEPRFSPSEYEWKLGHQPTIIPPGCPIHRAA